LLAWAQFTLGVGFAAANPEKKLRKQANPLNVLSGSAWEILMRFAYNAKRNNVTFDTSVEITRGLKEGDVVVVNQTTTCTTGGPGGPGVGIPFIGRPD